MIEAKKTMRTHRLFYFEKQLDNYSKARQDTKIKCKH